MKNQERPSLSTSIGSVGIHFLAVTGYIE